LERLLGKRVWITGASAGIGRELAVQLASCGCLVAVSARSADKLDELVAQLGNDRALAVPLDVTNWQANIDAMDCIRERFGGLDIALLNAGMLEWVDVRRFDSAVFERSMQTNYLSMVYGIEAALPLLRESPAPQIVGMSSTAGYRGTPRRAAYGASKAAIRFMLESLRIDLAPEHIAVTIVCPGFVRTSLTESNDRPMPMMVSAEQAARHIVRGIARRQHVVAFPKIFDLGLRALNLLPSRVYTALLARLGW
jgi:NAD(P)-dependent dehydrogenase (short-subunit alcohol dehydrogenase family)